MKLRLALASFLALSAALLLAGCGCYVGNDDVCDEDPSSEEGDCGAATVACIRSCTQVDDYRKYIDAECRGGQQICPDGTVTVESCED